MIYTFFFFCSHRLRTTGTCENGSLSFGNQLMTVTLDPSLDVNNLPLFGARYNFRLHGVVDLPEYLVYFPLFARLAFAVVKFDLISDLLVFM